MRGRFSRTPGIWPGDTATSDNVAGMRNPITDLVLGRGRISEAFRGRVAEGPLYVEEGVRAHITFRHLAAPGRRANVRRQWVRAAIVVTSTWVGVFARGRPLVNVAMDDPRFDAYEVEIRDGALVIAVDLARVLPGSSGRVEMVLRVSEPERAVEAIRSGHRSA